MKIAHSNSIAEAINNARVFLECDMYTKFRPEHKLPTMKNRRKIILKLYRRDTFSNEKEFVEYIRAHFRILNKEIVRGIGKKKFNAPFKKKTKRTRR